jgi:nucleoside-diphosphate-sugar epimerase
LKILILGGDGFCGWPTALHLSARDHDVAIVDNLSRRNIDNELETSSLTPIRPIGERIRAWNEKTGQVTSFYNFDVAENYHRLLTLIAEWRPDAIVHFAEQRAAPYSMKSSYHKRYTVNNNLNATNNLLAAIVESGVDSHVVHLGTMVVVGLTAATLSIIDRSLRWLQALRPLYGVVWLVVLALPWFIAIYARTGNAFLLDSVIHDTLGKVADAKESHGAPPGYYVVLFFATFFPGSILAGLAAPRGMG